MPKENKKKEPRQLTMAEKNRLASKDYEEYYRKKEKEEKK